MLHILNRVHPIIVQHMDSCLITFYFQKIVYSLADNESVYSVKGTINNLVTLGLDGEHMCYLIARVRQLLLKVGKNI